MIARVLGRALMVVVMAASGTYVLVYLYRWEWNRALIAGIFLLASQIALVASILVRRLSAIEDRLDKLTDEVPRRPLPSAGQTWPDEHSTPPPEVARGEPADTEVDDDVISRVKEAAPTRRPFAWLDPSDGSMSVFVPVLMGAGAMLSLLAWGVEKLAGLGATPALERGLARRMGLLAVPAGAMADPRIVPLEVEMPRRSTGQRAAIAGVAVIAATGLWWSVDGLADLTQDRPTTYPRDQVTVVELEYSYRGSGEPLRTTEDLWVTCRSVLPAMVEPVELVAVGSGGRLVLHPGLGEHAVRRFRGCLNDANLNRTTSHVVALDNAPWPPQS